MNQKSKKQSSPKEQTGFRSPIVAVLGHVDHGKTTLLDTIRKTNKAEKEVGGITQGIGASSIVTKEGKSITFVDTPGHAVFNEMRLMGAKVADIVVLVVAADDGVKPQTKEAIRYIKETKTPFLVAFTKTDLPSASVKKAQDQLAKESVLLEGLGGDTPFVEVSAKKNKGIDNLLEMVSLMAEINEIKGNPESDLDAVVIETHKGKMGSLVSVIIKDGTLKIGDEVNFVGGNMHSKGKVKGLFDQYDKPIKEALPGQPVQVLGFSSLPPMGSQIVSGDSIAARDNLESAKTPLEIKDGQIAVVIKVKNTGSLKAIEDHLPDDVVVVSSGAGEVSESDVFAAKSTGAYVFAFESKVPSRVGKLARTESVTIEKFDIVYKLFERIDEIIKEGQEEVLGKATVLAEFPFNKQRVAGSKVTEGRIAKSDFLVLIRGEKEIGRTKVGSMRKEKKVVDSVKVGEEFGLILSPYLDFKVGDVLVSVRKK